MPLASSHAGTSRSHLQVQMLAKSMTGKLGLLTSQNELLRSQTLDLKVANPGPGAGCSAPLLEVQGPFLTRFVGGVAQNSLIVTSNGYSFVCTAELLSPQHVKFRSHAAHKPHAGLDPNRASTGVI